MDKAKIFPAVLIVLQIGAALVCGARQDTRMFIYWTAAAILNSAVTF